MKNCQFVKKIQEYLEGLDLHKDRQLTFNADGGDWVIRTGMYEDIIEVRISFLKDGKMMKAWVYDENEHLLIQPF
jgi:hypothetical protein